MKKSETLAAVEYLNDQTEAHGAGVISVSDGYVFQFTRATLERLLAAAAESGRVVIFVKKELPI